MSIKKIQGSASFRLVTGFALAAFAISGVIAANLHTARLLTFTVSGRTSGTSAVVGKDAIFITMSGLTSGHHYEIYTNSSGMSTSDRSGGNGSGSSAANAAGFDSSDALGNYVKDGTNTWTFIAGGTGNKSLYVYTVDPSSTLTSQTISLYDQDTASTVASGMIDVKAFATALGTSAASDPWAVDPITGPATASLNVNSALVTNEKYEFRVTPSSNLGGWVNQTFAGAGTSGNPYAGNSGTTAPFTVAASTNEFISVVNPGTDNNNASLDVLDDSGNLIGQVYRLQIHA